LDLWAQVVAPLDRAGRLDLLTLHGMPRAITRRALHRWLLALKQPADLSRQGFELLLKAVEQGESTRFSLGRNGFAVIKQNQLAFVKK
jgi:tRNA(Ile)-lysidine synthase